MPEMVPPYIDLESVSLQKLMHPLVLQRRVQVDVLRLDKIHPLISGNKWFKLKYYLEEAKKQGIARIGSFGGPWSNHLLAVAALAKLEGLQAHGFIRGERPKGSQPVLEEMEKNGMQLQFLSRKDYAFGVSGLGDQEYLKDYLLIDQGGAGALGIRGASDIYPLTESGNYDIICCSVGTGTMMAGLAKMLRPGQKILGFSSLKLPPENNIIELLHKEAPRASTEILYDYHFGGFGKYTEELINFMNSFYGQCTIPSDLVYTAKLFQGFLQELQRGRFLAGQKVCIIHSGGLSGNRSLAPGRLIFG